ncbi:MAG TPA: hypothetical protein VG147_06520 [Solirubrobacteraceae bacterium]|jgi:hypothetical protein|nr:hypothetical protein [Solirubrobacteraceae bacterium]
MLWDAWVFKEQFRLFGPSGRVTDAIDEALFDDCHEVHIVAAHGEQDETIPVVDRVNLRGLIVLAGKEGTGGGAAARNVRQRRRLVVRWAFKRVGEQRRIVVG